MNDDKHFNGAMELLPGRVTTLRMIATSLHLHDMATLLKPRSIDIVADGLLDELNYFPPDDKAEARLLLDIHDALRRYSKKKKK